MGILSIIAIIAEGEATWHLVYVCWKSYVLCIISDCAKLKVVLTLYIFADLLSGVIYLPNIALCLVTTMETRMGY